MSDVISIFAAIGFMWTALQFSKLLRWYFFANRSGNSGRNRHWSEDR